MNKPLVSVIVPVYDVEQFLPQCLDSLVAQTLRDIEIICVNDGSPDASGEILARYAAQDPRIIVIDQPNAGLSVARNNALDRASGKYVSFVDSDDALKPDALETLYNRCEADSLDHVIFAAQVFYDGAYSVEKDVWTPYYTHKHKYGEIKSGPEAFADLVLNNDYVYAAQLRFSLRSRIETEKLRFWPGMIHEDNLFSFINDLTAHRALVMDEKPYLFRKRADSITTGTVKLKHVAGYLLAFMESLRYMQGKTFAPRVMQAIEKDLNRKYRTACRDYAKISKEDLAAPLPPFAGLPWHIAREPLRKEWRPALSSRSFPRPTVSVIIPAFNAQAHIVECIESLRSQTLQDFEVICVDDASTDDTPALLDMMALLDRRVKVLRSEERGGGGAARNFAMRFAFGEFLAFFDADDFAAPRFLENMVALARRDNADVVLAPSRRYSEAKREVVRTTAFSPDVLAAAAAGPVSVRSEAVARRALLDFGNQPWAKLFRRSYVERMKLSFQPIQRANDLYFVNLAIVLADRLALLQADGCENALYSYRVDAPGTCQATNDETPTLFLDAWRAFAREARARGAMSPALELSLANAVWGGALFTMARLADDAAKMRLARALRKWALKEFAIDALTQETCFNRKKFEELERFRASGWQMFDGIA